jgi:hypothetical protein
MRVWSSETMDKNLLVESLGNNIELYYFKSFNLGGDLILEVLKAVDSRSFDDDTNLNKQD